MSQIQIIIRLGKPLLRSEHTMELPQMLKRQKGFIFLFILSCFAIESMAQSTGKRILLYPMSGNGVTAGEAADIANDIKTTLINEGYTFAVDPRVVMKLAADKQKIGEEVKELGRAYSTDYIMPCILTKLNQTYKINCEIYHKVKIENGKEEWESWAGTGTVHYGNSLTDLSKKITNTQDKESSIVERIKVEEKAAENTFCINVDATYFMEGLGDCANSVQRSKDDFFKCAEKENRTFCGIANVNRSQTCKDSCRENARSLLAYLFLQAIYKSLQEKVDQCHTKGAYYNYDFEKKSCEYLNPNEAAEKEATAKKECEAKGSDYEWISPNCKLTEEAVTRLKKECEDEGRIWHGTYCSKSQKKLEWTDFIPGGGGFFVKKRPGYGIFFLVATVYSYDQYNHAREVYKETKQYYDYTKVLFTQNPLLDYYNYTVVQKAYQDSAQITNNQLGILFAVYFLNVIMSWQADKHENMFMSKKEEESRLVWNLSIYNRPATPYSSNSNNKSAQDTFYNFVLQWRF
jgi:hypothetical protein